MQMDMFFYLFGKFIGGADDDEVYEKYGKLNLNDPKQRKEFINAELKPTFLLQFDEEQKNELKEILTKILKLKIEVSERDINNQLFPFELPKDIRSFCLEIWGQLFENEIYN
jgi:hypothetical protein